MGGVFIFGSARSFEPYHCAHAHLLFLNLVTATNTRSISSTLLVVFCFYFKLSVPYYIKLLVFKEVSCTFCLCLSRKSRDFFQSNVIRFLSFGTVCMHLQLPIGNNVVSLGWQPRFLQKTHVCSGTRLLFNRISPYNHCLNIHMAT